jgi:hypothetical protein
MGRGRTGGRGSTRENATFNGREALIVLLRTWNIQRSGKGNSARQEEKQELLRMETSALEYCSVYYYDLPCRLRYDCTHSQHTDLWI